MQFGMPTLIENHTLQDNINLCKSLGLQFIEINMNFPEYQIDKLEEIDKFYTPANVAEIYYTIHLDENLNIADFNTLIANAYLETVKRTIFVAKKLIPLQNKYGNSNQPFIINAHLNHGIYITLPDRKVQMYERNFDIYMDSFKNFRILCEEWIGNDNIVIAIENTDGFKEYEKKAIEYLLNSPKFGLTWDIGHSKAIGETDVPFILSHKDKLQHFHIHNAKAKSERTKGSNHLSLDDGEIDIKERLATAEKCNAKCVLETKTIESLKKSVEFLKATTNFLKS